MKSRVAVVLILGAAVAASRADDKQPKFPPLPAASWEMTGNGFEGKLVITSAPPVAQEPSVQELAGTLYGDKVAGFYDRRTGRLRFLRSNTQVWEGDFDPKTSGIKGRFHPVTTGGGLPPADGNGFAWETTRLVPAAPPVAVPDPGPKTVTVPLVREMSPGSAADVLAKAGLKAKFNYAKRPPGDTSDGWVSGQTPFEGKEVPEGTTVTLQVSYGLRP